MPPDAVVLKPRPQRWQARRPRLGSGHAGDQISVEAFLPTWLSSKDVFLLDDAILSVEADRASCSLGCDELGEERNCDLVGVIRYHLPPAHIGVGGPACIDVHPTVRSATPS